MPLHCALPHETLQRNHDRSMMRWFRVYKHVSSNSTLSFWNLVMVNFMLYGKFNQIDTFYECVSLRYFSIYTYEHDVPYQIIYHTWLATRISSWVMSKPCNFIIEKPVSIYHQCLLPDHIFSVSLTRPSFILPYMLCLKYVIIHVYPVRSFHWHCINHATALASVI